MPKKASLFAIVFIIRGWLSIPCLYRLQAIIDHLKSHFKDCKKY